jgi:Tfp pilus assembly protein PilN
MTTQVTTPVRLDGLVRVNLLPPEIGQRRRLRRIQAGLAALVALAVVGVGAGWWQASQSVTSAQGELETAQAEGVKLQAQAAQYAEVPKLAAQLAEAQGNLDRIQANEVHWSTQLADLSLRVPSTVWLTQMAVTQSFPAAAAPAAGDPLAPANAIGTLTYQGYALQQADVATWLDSLARLSGADYPWFTNATKQKIGDREVVQFTSTAQVTGDALAKAAGTKAGS